MSIKKGSHILSKTSELIDSTRLIPQSIILESGVIKIEKSIDSKKQKSLIVHALPLNGFKSESLYAFLKGIVSLYYVKFEGLIPLYGVSSTSRMLHVLYYDDDLNTVNLDSLTESQSNQLPKTTASVLHFLHSNEFQHHRIKTSSSFTKDSTRFYVGCIQPFPIIDLEGEDINLLFYKQSAHTHDVFMFEFLVIEVLTRQTQSNLLSQLWEFKEIANGDNSTDKLKSVSLFLKGADMGHAVSQYNVGLSYLKGLGFSGDLSLERFASSSLPTRATPTSRGSSLASCAALTSTRAPSSSGLLRARRSLRPSTFTASRSSPGSVSAEYSLNYFGAANEYAQLINNYAACIKE